MATIWGYVGGCDTYTTLWTNVPKGAQNIDYSGTPDFTLTSVTAYLQRSGDIGTVHAELYAADADGFPTGAVLSSGTVLGSTISDSSPTVWSLSDTPTTFTMSTYAVSYASPGFVLVIYADGYTGYPYSKLYWHGVATGAYTYGHASSATSGGVWSSLHPKDHRFTVLGTTSGGPSKPTTPTPANNATAVDFSGFQLSWVNGGGATSYNVYVGVTGSPSIVSFGQTGTTYTTSLAELEGIFGVSPINQKIYWRVDAVNAVGTTTGDEWNFDARPAKVTTPSPVNAATGQRLFPTYGWAASTIADTYNIIISKP